MKVEATSRIPHWDRQGDSSATPFVMLAVGIPWGIWTVYALLNGAGSDLVAFVAAEGWFVLLATAYLRIHGLKGVAWCDLPVLLTFAASIQYIGISTWQIFAEPGALDFMYVRAIFLVLLGFIGFWIGSLAVRNEGTALFAPLTLEIPGWRVFMVVAMLIFGSAGKVILWRSGLFAYAADPGQMASSAGSVQWLLLLTNLLNASLVVSAIEVIGKRSTNSFIKLAFWFSLMTLVGYGAVSGMKAELFYPLASVVLVYGVTRGKFPRFAFLLPLLLIVVYPFENAYRENLNQGYRAQVNTLEGQRQVIVKTLSDVIKGAESKSEVAATGLRDTVGRLSLLDYVHNVISLPSPSMLRGDEKVWLAPVYPLVPRFLWKDKPVLNKGGRLAYLLGVSSGSSAALTEIGDLYVMYGTSGVVAGMFVWGAFLQLSMNWIKGRNMSERNVFIYVMMAPVLLNLEADVVGLIVATIQFGLFNVLCAYVVYGRSEPAFSGAIRKAR